MQIGIIDLCFARNVRRYAVLRAAAIPASGKHMATGNSLVDARLMIDLHENHLTSQQLPVSKERVIADAAINR